MTGGVALVGAQAAPAAAASPADTTVGSDAALTVTSLLVNASTTGGPGIDVENAGYAGSAISAANNDSTNQQAAVYGWTKGKGPGVEGLSVGGGPGVQGDSNSPGLYGCGVRGNGVGYSSGVVGTTGQGNGVYGYSTDGYGITGASTTGRGGHFAGVAAQIQLSPGSAGTHPTSGATGDLYVDSTARLWFCTAGGTTATWMQVQVA